MFSPHPGGFRWVLLRGKVISRDDDGNPLRFVGTSVDVTQRKEDERALILAKEAAERASKAKAGEGQLVIFFNQGNKVLLLFRLPGHYEP